MEEAYSRQNDRIAYLRSIGQPWAEAVYELRDMLVGLEDEEFWDGIPPHVRKDLEAKSEDEREAIKETYSEHGWSTHRIRAFPIRNAAGEVVPVYRPTPENLSTALRIVRRLATRVGITWKRKRVSRLPSYEENGVEH